MFHRDPIVLDHKFLNELMIGRVHKVVVCDFCCLEGHSTKVCLHYKGECECISLIKNIVNTAMTHFQTLTMNNRETTQMLGMDLE